MDIILPGILGLLAGKIITDQGEPFTPTHANKAGKRYRYYVSRPRDADPEGDAPHRRWRIPAVALEELVVSSIRRFLGDSKQLRAILAAAKVPELDQLQALDRAERDERRVSAAAARPAKRNATSACSGGSLCCAWVRVRVKTRT